MRLRNSACATCRCRPRRTRCGRPSARRKKPEEDTMEAMHYHRPTSVAEAVKLLGSHGDDRVLAGGQSMLPSLRLGLLATSGFVDLGGIPELQGIKVDGNKIVVGAMTTHAAV